MIVVWFIFLAVQACVGVAVGLLTWRWIKHAAEQRKKEEAHRKLKETILPPRKTAPCPVTNCRIKKSHSHTLDFIRRLAGK